MKSLDAHDILKKNSGIIVEKKIDSFRNPPPFFLKSEKKLGFLTKKAGGPVARLYRIYRL